MTGASFTAVTVKINVVESVKLPSEAQALILETPFQFAFGVRVNVEDETATAIVFVSDFAEKVIGSSSASVAIKEIVKALS